MRYCVFAAISALAVACSASQEDRAVEEPGGVYSDPVHDFAFTTPDGVEPRPIAGGALIFLVAEASGDTIGMGEVIEFDSTAEEWVEPDLHGGDLFVANALWRTQAWCAADGPQGTQYCVTAVDLGQGQSFAGMPFLRFSPVLTYEDFRSGDRSDRVIGPVRAVQLPQQNGTDRLLMLFPSDRALASDLESSVGEAIVRSVRSASGS